MLAKYHDFEGVENVDAGPHGCFSPVKACRGLFSPWFAHLSGCCPPIYLNWHTFRLITPTFRVNLHKYWLTKLFAPDFSADLTRGGCLRTLFLRNNLPVPAVPTYLGSLSSLRSSTGAALPPPSRPFLSSDLSLFHKVAPKGAILFHKNSSYLREWATCRPSWCAHA